MKVLTASVAEQEHWGKKKSVEVATGGNFVETVSRSGAAVVKRAASVWRRDELNASQDSRAELKARDGAASE